MGRKRKAYQDKFKIDAVREALHSGADRTEVAIKYNIAQSTLSEWITMFLEGKILTDEQKALEEKIAILEKQQEIILMELGKKQLEIDLLKKKKTRICWRTLETDNSKVKRQKWSKAYDFRTVQTA